MVTRGDGVWPFRGHRDAQDAEQVQEGAKELFIAAENQDIYAGGAETTMMSGMHAFNHAAHAAAFTMGAASVANRKLGERQFETAKLVTNEMTIMTKGMKGKLPCYIAIRLYGQGDDKFSAISVRVYACGRLPRAAVQEVCHFTLRTRDAKPPKPKDGQLWYGRTLQPKVDLAFFKFCLNTCKGETSHQKSCGEKPPFIRIRPQSPWTFRLVDVIDECVVKEEFTHFADPNSPHAYVALSHVWGHRPLDLDELVLNAKTNPTLMQKGSLANARAVKLATTIKDATEILKGMGQRFLWVDKLCVVQKSGPDLTKLEQRELNHTIENMGRIYSHALFTIVDGNSESSSDDGLLMKRFGRDTSGQIIKEVTPEVSIFLPTSMPSNLTRWESRAWMFQEKVLSRRMLVFSDGFAQWQCQEGVWREDVNARDVNPATIAISPSYLKAEKPTPGMSSEKAYGLQEDDTDGSMRLYRTTAFSQYAQCVHDYSTRTIRESGEVLAACTGILSILGSKALLDTEFLHGLLCKFMDSALLWHTRFDIRRRTGDAPPSWSWAGWELDRDSRNFKQIVIQAAERESQGPSVFYPTPFDVHFDADGLKMHLTPKGEERMRPLASIYRVPREDVPFPQLGLFGMPWTSKPDTRTGYNNWEYNRIRDLPASHFLEMSDQGLSDHIITDKHLIICTEEASLYLGAECSNVRKYSPSLEAAYPNFEADSAFAGDSRARERWLYLDKELKHKIGIATHYTEHRAVQVRAILLSEAQYLGNEVKPDVLRYPLYNIMLIQEANNEVVKTASSARISIGNMGESAMNHVGLGSVRSEDVVERTAFTRARSGNIMRGTGIGQVRGEEMKKDDVVSALERVLSGRGRLTLWNASVSVECTKAFGGRRIHKPKL